jgi:isopenicillin N synthase-like dioxygenase
MLKFALLAIVAALVYNYYANQQKNQSSSIPVIDIAKLSEEGACPHCQAEIKESIGVACRDHGFFYVKGTGIPEELTSRIEASSRTFFAQDNKVKREIDMSKGGYAWRGYFAVGDELTSGRADQKEGIYFGIEEDPQDVRPLHGPNLWPTHTGHEQYKKDVLEYLEHMKRVSNVIMDAISTHLYSLTNNNEQEQLQNDFKQSFFSPTELFRVFGYPAPNLSTSQNPDPADFGVAEHTDYGYITVLYQDNTGGLQVKTSSGWEDVPPIPGTFVVNLGDALEHHSRGYLKATSHRVLHHRKPGASTQQRISFPYFFDPDMSTIMSQIKFSDSNMNLASVSNAQQRLKERWDGQDLTLFKGSYKDYLLNKISKVFPELYENVVGKYNRELQKTKQVEMDEIMEWTVRKHKTRGSLSDEEQSEEDELRKKLEAWNAANA